jgi:glucose-6-phosphate 1-dehydrogenase
MSVARVRSTPPSISPTRPSSLSFLGKRPGPGRKLDKLSPQLALHEIEESDNVLEPYERLIIHDSMSGDQTLFTNAEGIERVREVSQRLVDDPPEVQLHRVGSWEAAVHARPDRAPLVEVSLRAGLASEAVTHTGRHD